MCLVRYSVSGQGSTFRCRSTFILDMADLQGITTSAMNTDRIKWFLAEMKRPLVM